SNRYDFWRVAADDFSAHPLAGQGSENFAEYYVQHRHSSEEPAYPHNLTLQVLAGTGLIGGLLFGGFLVVSLVGIGRIRIRGPDPLARGLAGILAVVFVYWFVHSIGDWFWGFAALSAPIFAWLGMAMRLDAEREAVAQPRWAKSWAAPAVAMAAVALIFALVTMVLPWAAA